MMQEAIVGVIVLYATWCVTLRYLPMAWRRTLRASMARLARRAGLAMLARRLETAPRAAASCGSDSGCGSCGGCDEAPAGTVAPLAEQRIRVDTLRGRMPR